MKVASLSFPWMIVKRFPTLDGLRGVAAASVVLYHYGRSGLLPAILPNAALAVDFFFILSGFIIAHAYGRALSAGLGWRGFAARRLIRLYPLAALGAALGLVNLALRGALDPATVDGWPQIFASALLNAVLLPMPAGGPASNFALFPGDTPLWSLFFELAINLVWAAGLFRLSTTGKLAVAVSGAVIVAMLVPHDGVVDLGFNRTTFAGGAGRVTVGFFAGLLLHHIHHRVALPRVPVPTAVLGVVLLAIFAVDPASLGAAAAAWSLLCLLVLLPAVVLLGAAQPGEGRADGFLGDLSYPVYVLHAPILVAAQEGLRLQATPLPAGIIAILGLAATAAFSLAAFRLYDRPVRAALAAALRSPAPEAAARRRKAA